MSKVEKSAKLKDLEGIVQIADQLKLETDTFIERQESMRAKDDELFHVNIDQYVKIIEFLGKS